MRSGYKLAARGAKLWQWVGKYRQALSEACNTPVDKWSLDYPSPKRDVWLTNAGRVIQGWVLLKSEFVDARDQVRILAEWQPAFELCHELDIARPDVVEGVLEEDAAHHPQRLCGFRFTVPPDLPRFRLWLELNGQRWMLQDVQVEPQHAENPVLKVLAGQDGWLFLDNDTNFSVDQFTGSLRLTPEGLEGWELYVQSLQQGHDGLRAPPVLLVAPTKETVMGAYHPLKPATRSCLQPVFDVLPAGQLVFPAVELRDALGEEAFFKTDTHWTHKGAALAAKLVAERLGLAAADLDRLLSNDRYVERPHAGDLGGKLSPRMTAPAHFLASFSYRKWVVYDNGLPNFGRLLIMNYPQSLSDSTCLVFGSSSSYSMFHFLCRFFRRTIFVHTAGNLDAEVIRAVQPDYLIAQTNARFMIRPPEAAYDLRQTIEQKQASLEGTALELQAKNRNLSGMDLLESLGLSPWHLTVSEIDLP